MWRSEPQIPQASVFTRKRVDDDLFVAHHGGSHRISSVFGFLEL
jgi:hypothetical protein